jgi:hypothetical protein
MTGPEPRDYVLDSPYEGLLTIPRDVEPVIKTDKGDWFEKLKAVYYKKMALLAPETNDLGLDIEQPAAPRREYQEGETHDPEKFFAEALATQESPERKARAQWYKRNLEMLSVREADIRNHRAYARVNLSLDGKQLLSNLMGLHRRSYYYADNFNSAPPVNALLDLESDAVVYGARLFGGVNEGQRVRFSNTKPGEWFYHEAPIVNPDGREIAVFYVVNGDAIVRQDHRGYERLNVHNPNHNKELKNFLEATEIYHSFVSDHVYRRRASDLLQAQFAV